MKKLSKEELHNFNLKGKGRSSEIFNSIINLKIGEGLLIEPKDWHRKASPSTLVKYIQKTHHLQLSYAALADAQGWLVKRLEEKQHTINSNPEPKAVSHIEPPTTNLNDNHFRLKSELTIFYLGRISFLKIEKIEDSIKSAQEHFRDENRVLIKTLFEEIIKVLSKQQHIIIENEKTYIPLKKS
jgi:hypothetical protein